jgi:molybdopterin-guanine dinucleotide biosynthesis protein A
MTTGKSELMVAGYVLAGGGSTRFGRDKALAKVGGVPILERTIGLVISATEEVVIVGPRERYEEFGVEIVRDRWPGEGPLGGIITALEVTAQSPAKREWNLIVSCDMPFLTREWLVFLTEQASKSEAQIVAPSSPKGPEPLCACYRTNAAGALRRAFEGGVRKVTDGWKCLSTEVLDESVWKRFDSAGRLFWNMNTAADFEEVRRVWETERV